MEPRKWKRTTGEQSLVQRNVLTNNGKEELPFSRSRQESHFLLKSCRTSSLPVSPQESQIQVTRLSLNTLSSPEEKSGKSKSSSAPPKEGKSGSSSSGLKRRLGRKTASPSEYDDFGKEFIGELEKELDMELDRSDDVRKRRPKGDAVDYLDRLVV